MFVQNSEVLVLKMCNGDEVIATVKDRTGDTYTVENPFVLIMTQQGAQFAPMMIMADMDSSIEIHRPNVVSTGKPTKNMLEGYKKSTSKIVVPSKPGIII